MLVIFFKAGNIVGLNPTHFVIDKLKLIAKVKKEEMLLINGVIESDDKYEIDIELCSKITFDGEVLHEVKDEKKDL